MSKSLYRTAIGALAAATAPIKAYAKEKARLFIGRRVLPAMVKVAEFFRERAKKAYNGTSTKIDKLYSRRASHWKYVVIFQQHANGFREDITHFELQEARKARLAKLEATLATAQADKAAVKAAEADLTQAKQRHAFSTKVYGEAIRAERKLTA